jgi:hypothetical protein
MILHLAALLIALLATSLWSLALNRGDLQLALKQDAIFGGIGALSAQLAALLRWRALERRARAGEGAWLTGLGMAAITHVLFGLIFTAALNASVRWLQPDEAGTASDVVLQALFFVAMSVLVVGVVSFPLTAALAQGIAALRRKELADGAV